MICIRHDTPWHWTKGRRRSCQYTYEKWKQIVNRVDLILNLQYIWRHVLCTHDVHIYNTCNLLNSFEFKYVYSLFSFSTDTDTYTRTCMWHAHGLQCIAIRTVNITTLHYITMQHISSHHITLHHTTTHHITSHHSTSQHNIISH